MMLKTSIVLSLLSLLVAYHHEADAATCRSSTVKHRFDVINGYPHGRPSLPKEEKWIVDHWCALECGGIDSTSNMVYQQYSDSKAKDKWERTIAGCKKTCNQFNSTPTRQVINCK
jgi:hypothetical protein